MKLFPTLRRLPRDNPYADWTSTADNGLRAAVIPLVAGSLLLIVFLAIARWDMIWGDPGRLPGIWDMSAFLAGSNGRGWLTLSGLPLALISLILGIAVLVSVWRTDKWTVVTPAGIA